MGLTITMLSTSLWIREFHADVTMLVPCISALLCMHTYASQLDHNGSSVMSPICIASIGILNQYKLTYTASHTCHEQMMYRLHACAHACQDAFWQGIQP